MQNPVSGVPSELAQNKRVVEEIRLPHPPVRLSFSIRQRVWPWWFVAIAWFVVTSLAHLEFSLWLVSPRQASFGSFRFSDLVPVVVVAGLLCLSVCLYRQARACTQPARFGLWWVGWFACAMVIDRHLTFSINEFAHYPQYALLAWLLARAYDPERARWVPGRILFWAALLGTVDELQQYVWIAPAYGLHLDFNDILVNLVAAAAGVMLYYGASLGGAGRHVSLRGSGFPLAELLVAGVLTIAVSWLLVIGGIVTKPAAPVPPGGLVFSEEYGWRLYLEREAGVLGGMAVGQRHDVYLILDPLRAFTFMALFGLVYGRYPLWPWEWLRRRPAIQPVIHVSNEARR